MCNMYSLLYMLYILGVTRVHPLLVTYLNYLNTSYLIPYLICITKVLIQGYGHIFMESDGHTILLPNVLFVPHLTSNLFLVTEHCIFQNCTQLAISNSMILTFPTFCLEATLSNNHLHFTHISK